jgi:hypothetical protein
VPDGYRLCGPGDVLLKIIKKAIQKLIKISKKAKKLPRKVLAVDSNTPTEALQNLINKYAVGKMLKI